MFARYSHVPGPTNPLLVSVAEALTATLALSGGSVTATSGCTDANTTTECQTIDDAAVARAMAHGDVLVFCVGTGEPVESETSNTGPTLALPGQQEALIAAGIATGKPVVVVRCVVAVDSALRGRHGASCGYTRSYAHGSVPSM